MHKTFTRSTLVTISIITVAVTGVYVALFLYIKHMQTQTAVLDEKVAFEERRGSQETALKLLAKDIKPDLDTLSGFIVSNENEGDIAFIKNLEQLGAAQSVSLKIISAAEVAQDAFKIVTFQIAIQGGWSHVLHVVGLIESLPYKISVKEVTMSHVDTGSVAGKKDGRHEWRAALMFTVIKDSVEEPK